MSDVTTAAFDPIFWVHHCNIDRLWSLWDATQGRQWGAAPEREWFDACLWWFYDADGQIKNESRASFYIQNKIGVAYDSDPAGPPRL